LVFSIQDRRDKTRRLQQLYLDETTRFISLMAPSDDSAFGDQESNAGQYAGTVEKRYMYQCAGRVTLFMGFTGAKYL
jgi:hypothetical protein